GIKMQEEILRLLNQYKETETIMTQYLNLLNKEDDEINYRLLYLKDNSLDLDLRKFLSTVIK
ncbi:hypothetical protein H9X78_07375, partial [Clostridium saudiense]|nr:hypothetical protein [Clostridium saudiense]